MTFLDKYKIFILLVFLEGLFYFRLDMGNSSEFFLGWAIAGIMLFLFSAFNMVKANPILSLFNKDMKVEQPQKLLSDRNIAYMAFILLNLILTIIF
jgi:hypothetical protein